MIKIFDHRDGDFFVIYLIKYVANIINFFNKLRYKNKFPTLHRRYKSLEDHQQKINFM
jgi:hypothetical protein